MLCMYVCMYVAFPPLVFDYPHLKGVVSAEQQVLRSQVTMTNTALVTMLNT